MNQKPYIYIMGIGDWGLGIGDWGLGPIPNPQSPIPNPHFFFWEIHGTFIIYNKNIFSKIKLFIIFYHLPFKINLFIFIFFWFIIIQKCDIRSLHLQITIFILFFFFR